MIICRTQKQIEHKIIEIEKLIDEYPHMSDSTLNELEGMTLALYWILIPADTKLNKTMELIKMEDKHGNIIYAHEHLDIDYPDAEKVFEIWEENLNEKHITFEEYVNGWVEVSTYDDFIHKNIDAFIEMIDEGFDSYVEYMAETTNSNIFRSVDKWVICPKG